ncbi:ABC-type branched-chain amino acid transport system, substrate-binding protein [Frankineae bacterium MT45]|nr:ABC-type branched-chain amino acid transport system, substrate-binding protein [Frankineae bacterium MT45]
MLVGSVAVSLVLSSCSSSSKDASSTSSAPTGSAAAAAFKVDTSQCDDPASATKKITDTWKIGYSAPLSGPIAGVASFALDGFKARIAAQNAAGGINGVKIDVNYKDDQYTPDKAKANTTEFIQSDHVDSLATFGSGPVGAIADDQNAACVPLLYPSSSVQQYRDISQYPWTVQFLPAGEAEARYDVNYILSKYPNGAKVGIAENQNASGVGEYNAFVDAAKGTKVTVAVVADQTDPNAAATKIAAAKPEVVYNAGITTDCGPLVIAMARIGFKPSGFTMNPDNCADSTAYIAAGEAADGNVIPSYLKSVTDPTLSSDAGVQAYLSQVTGADKDNTITIAGWTEADLTINTLLQASKMPGGLSHVTAIQAARDQDYASPMLGTGITWQSTPTALVGFSGFQTLVWSASEKAFKKDGPVVSVAAK